MEERERKSILRRITGGLLTLLGAALLCTVVYLGSVLLQPETDAEDFQVKREETVSRLQAGDFTDQRLLRDAFGAMLPTLPGESMKGEARNQTYAGEVVRHVVMRFENGVEITAVQPASASPLLLRKDLQVSPRTDVQVLHVPAMLAAKGDEYCLYFEYDGAAYGFYAAGVTEEKFLSLAAALEKVP